MSNITPERWEILFAERSELSKAQEEALKRAMYIPMDEEELRVYWDRRARIKYLTAMLAQRKAG